MSLANGSARRFWTPARLVLTFCILSALTLFGFSACNSNEATNAPTPSDPKAEGSPVAKANGPRDTSKLTPVPVFALNASLKDTQGSPLKLSEFAGKVVVVNLWATWCGPCRVEMPELVQISKEYKERGVEIVGLTNEYNDPDVEAVKDFLRAQNVPYRTIYEDGSFTRSLADATNARGVIPQSYVITRDGKILTHFEGFDPRTTPNRMRQMIELALSYKT